MPTTAQVDSEAVPVRVAQELSKEGLAVLASPQRLDATTGVKTDNRVVLQVAAGDQDGRKREAVHLCLVLDRSAEMLPLLKEAAKEALRLLSTKDAVSLITVGGGEVQTPFARARPAEGELLAALVDAVPQGDPQAPYCTGLEAAATVLEGSEALQLAFLLSDRQGRAEEAELCALTDTLRAITSRLDMLQVSTFGFGAGVDAALLDTIARCGKGSYHPVALPEHIPGVVEKSLAEHAKVLARDARLVVRGLHGNAVGGLQGACDYDTLVHGYRLGSLCSLGVRRILVDMELNPTPFLEEGKEGGEVPLLQYRLFFTPSGSPSPGETCISGTVMLSYTNDTTKLATVAHDVTFHAAVVACASLEREFRSARCAGDVPKAKALKSQIVKHLQIALPSDRFGVIAAALDRSQKAEAALNEEVQRTHAEPPPIHASQPYDDDDDDEDFDYGFDTFD